MISLHDPDRQPNADDLEHKRGDTSAQYGRIRRAEIENMRITGADQLELSDRWREGLQIREWVEEIWAAINAVTR